MRHYIGRLTPAPSVVGRRLLLSSDAEVVEKSVRQAAAVVLISGYGGTEWIAEEAARQQRPIIPIAATGGAAAGLVRRWELELPRELAREDATAGELATAVREELSRVFNAPWKSSIEDERSVIADALRATAGNRVQAARLLKIGRRTLQAKIARYQL